MSLSFNNADIDSVISAISRVINKSMIVDPKVKGSITLNSQQALNQNEIIDKLATALRLNGFALVETPNGYRVVTEADAKLQSTQTFTTKNNVVGDQIITRVIKLNHESAPNVVALLKPLVSPNNTINALPGNNSILITDYASNISRIEKIIQSVDSPSNTTVETISLKNAQALEVAALINKVMENNGPQGGDGLSKLNIVADPRANVLLVRGGNAERVAQIKSLVAKLDVSKSSGNIWVIPLKNAEASKLAITLRALVAADSSFANPSSPGAQMNVNPVAPNQGIGGAPVNVANNGNQMGGPPSAAATSALTSTSGPSVGGSIQADPITNSLIITATEPVYKNLLKVVQQLDRKRAQIYIESMIVELSSTNAAELGVQWQALIGSNQGFAGSNFIGPNSSGNTNIQGASGSINNAVNNNNAAANALLNPLGLGLNLGTLTQFGPNLAFSTLLRSLQSINGTNILSTPNLMTLDNEEARIIVGQNIPILTGSYSQTASTATVTPFQTYTRQDVGITLRVRPQSSENGTVKLQIFQEVSGVQRDTLSGPILNKRNIESNVVVEDGQIIVLGGLIGDEYSDNSQKIPVLGDIPLIGGLFRYDNKTRTKTNLMVFIRPRVLRDGEQNIEFSNTKLDDFNQKREQFAPVPILNRPEKLNDQSLQRILQ